MRTNILFIAFFLFQAQMISLAQTQNFVVTTKGDTITGDIKLYTLGPDKKVVVKGDKKITVPILQTRLIQLDGDTFKPVRSSRGYQFMKVIKSGYLSLLGYQAENQSSFDAHFLQKLDGTSLDVPNLSFRKMMVNFLSDCPAVSAKIDNNDLGKSDLFQIVDEYNACITSKTQQLAATQTEVVKSASSNSVLTEWRAFEKKVNDGESFEGKEEAIEMIKEVQLKLSRGEKIPKFILEGLKETLSETSYFEDLTSLIGQSGL